VLFKAVDQIAPSGSSGASPIESSLCQVGRRGRVGARRVDPLACGA